MSKEKKFIVKVVVKAKDPSKLPDWGLGHGVLATQECSFPAEESRIRIALGLNEVYRNLLEDNIKEEIEEII